MHLYIGYVKTVFLKRIYVSIVFNTFNRVYPQMRGKISFSTGKPLPFLLKMWYTGSNTVENPVYNVESRGENLLILKNYLHNSYCIFA